MNQPTVDTISDPYPLLRGRNNPLSDVDATKMNEYFELVAKTFDINWLSDSTGTNRLQKLWQRDDGLATNQIAHLGDALARMIPGNDAWVKRCVTNIKAETPEKRKGDLFELLGLSFFVTSDQTVIGAPDDEPGFDGTIQFPSGPILKMSLKDFGSSPHQAIFEKHAASIEAEFIKSTKEIRINALAAKIVATQFPLTADWERLGKALNKELRRVFNRDSNFRVGIWDVTLAAAIQPGQQLSPAEWSYTFTVTSPYQANEQKNIDRRIGGAGFG